jgi:hypothetical protein
MNRKTLPFPRIQLTLLIPLVLVSLASYALQVQAQVAESASNSLDNAQTPLVQGGKLADNSAPTSRGEGWAEHFAQPPNLPENGAPTGRRTGGASRDGCPTPLTGLTALVPGEETSSNSTSFLTLTVSEYPTFWFYVPELPLTARSAEFIVQDEEDKTIYQVSLSLPEKPGVIGISLPSNPQNSLETNKNHHWYLKVYCGNPQTEIEYFYLDGWVQRVPLTPAIESQIKAEQPREYIAYAGNGIWLDAVTTLADLRSTDPDNLLMAQDWADLLKAAGLQDLAQEPIVGRYPLE